MKTSLERGKRLLEMPLDEPRSSGGETRTRKRMNNKRKSS